MQKNDVTSHPGPGIALREVAGILAAGILRLRARAALPGAQPGQENLPKSSEDGLEVPGETVLSGHTGSRFPRSQERRKSCS